ncbi:MAG: hypothetical protein CMH26_01205 [Micavibrio sp.]|nr:hypothetical protein [Micavibrio sp.]
MLKTPLYEYEKSLKQRAIIFFNMCAMSLLYLAGIVGYDIYKPGAMPEDLVFWSKIIFSIAAIITLIIGIKARKSDKIYRAIVTTDRLIIEYPDVEQWSFDLPLKDIKRFEKRQALGGGGPGIIHDGILMKDGTYHEISVNYGVSIGKMLKAVQRIHPDIEQRKTINKSAPGIKDYDD